MREYLATKCAGILLGSSTVYSDASHPYQRTHISRLAISRCVASFSPRHFLADLGYVAVVVYVSEEGCTFGVSPGWLPFVD